MKYRGRIRRRLVQLGTEKLSGDFIDDAPSVLLFGRIRQFFGDFPLAGRPLFDAASLNRWAIEARRGDQQMAGRDVSVLQTHSDGGIERNNIVPSAQ